MEQIRYLQSLLQIKYLPDIRVGGNSYKNSDALLGALVVFTVLNLVGLFYPFSLLLFGIVLPVWCLLRGADLGGYFPVLSLFLWLRTWELGFSTLDVTALPI